LGKQSRTIFRAARGVKGLAQALVLGEVIYARSKALRKLHV
jgi:hypothetical protein